MTAINTSFRTITTAEGTTDTQSTALVETASELQDAMRNMEDFMAQYEGDLTDEQIEDLRRLMATARLEYAAFEGAINAPASQGSQNDTGTIPTFDRPSVLPAEWSGEHANNPDEEYRYVQDDPDKYGAYEGIIDILNSGNPNTPNKLAFQITDDMDVKSVTGESHGRDIIITVKYTDGKETRSWVIRDGTVRPEPIIISANGCLNPVKIDMSKIIRINDGTYPVESYKTQKMYIWGSEGDDTIIGSQGVDKIVGMAGNDTINGQGGDDVIWGDEYYQNAGTFDRNYGGNDNVKGGMGNDIIYGGGGVDNTYTSDKGEAVAESEHTIQDSSSAAPNSEFITPGDNWEKADSSDDGMIVLENTTGIAGQIDIDMATAGNYNMAVAEANPNGDLVITMAGEEGSFKIKIKNFFGEFGAGNPANASLRLNFLGSDNSDIIDFSRIHTTSQVINLKGGGNDDIMLGARNALLTDGVDIERLLSSQASGSDLSNYLGEDYKGPFYFTEDDTDKKNGYVASSGQGGQIEIERDPLITDDSKRDKFIRLVAPEGYNKVYAASDTDNNIYLVLVKPSVNGEAAKTIVIKVDSDVMGLDEDGYPKLTLDDIRIGNKVAVNTADGTEYKMNWLDITPISNTKDYFQDFALDGGEGSDLIFYQAGSRIEDGEDDSTVEYGAESESSNAVEALAAQALAREAAARAEADGEPENADENEDGENA